MEQFIQNQNYSRTLPLRKYFPYETAQKYQTPWSVFQDGSKLSDKQHNPGNTTSGEVGCSVILDTRPAGRLPFPEEVACLLAGPAPIVPAMVDESTAAKTERYACFQRFHVLFHFLSKVLFIFPSRYFFAIGLESILSLRGQLPPI